MALIITWETQLSPCRSIKAPPFQRNNQGLKISHSPDGNVWVVCQKKNWVHANFSSKKVLRTRFVRMHTSHLLFYRKKKSHLLDGDCDHNFYMKANAHCLVQFQVVSLGPMLFDTAPVAENFLLLRRAQLLWLGDSNYESSLHPSVFIPSDFCSFPSIAGCRPV